MCPKQSKPCIVKCLSSEIMNILFLSFFFFFCLFPYFYQLSNNITDNWSRYYIKKPLCDVGRGRQEARERIKRMKLRERQLIPRHTQNLSIRHISVWPKLVLTLKYQVVHSIGTSVNLLCIWLRAGETRHKGKHIQMHCLSAFLKTAVYRERQSVDCNYSRWKAWWGTKDTHRVASSEEGKRLP